MASLCKRQQCTIDRRGFRQELDSWRHKLIHCVGFESILEGLFDPRLVEELKLFKGNEPATVSDWSFDENCLFCCLRRDKVKEHLIGLSEGLEDSPKPLLVKDQITINRLEKQAEEFLSAVLSRKDVPNFPDSHIPVVAREILQRMIRQFAAEYTSKPSSPQDSCSESQPGSDQSQPTSPLPSGVSPLSSPTPALAGPAHNQNPVLSKLLMADQDAPLDLTIKKPLAEPTEQDGVLDLSIKKNRSSTPSDHSPKSLQNGESTDIHASKAKDLQSTSTLEQFFAKLCPHHQRQIVDALGFLQTEVKAYASYKIEKDVNTASGVEGSPCFAAESTTVTSKKTDLLPRFSNKFTTKSEIKDVSKSILNSCVIKQVPESAVSLKTSVTAGPDLDLCSLSSESGLALATFTSNSLNVDHNHNGEHAPLKMKIMTSKAAAGKKLSCVLSGSLSESLDDRQVGSKVSSRIATCGARLSSSVKRHSQTSQMYQAKQRDALEHAKDTPEKAIPMHTTILSDTVRTARKAIRPSTYNQTRESSNKVIVDPDLGHCDIVFIDKPITECFKKRHRGMAPRRNARKSTRGRMYSDEIWELKTVRTLAGRGNCPNPMPELITLVTPKQILSKPDAIPPLDMLFAEESRNANNQEIIVEELVEHVIPGTEDIVEVASIDVMVEHSQTSQCQSNGASDPSLPLVYSSKNAETIPNTDIKQEIVISSRTITEIKENVEQTSFDTEKRNGIEPLIDAHVTEEQLVPTTLVDPLENVCLEEADPQLLLKELHQPNTPIPLTDEVEEERQQDEREEMQDVQPQEHQPETQVDGNDSEVIEKVNSAVSPKKVITKEPQAESKAPEAESKAPQAESKAPQAESKAPQAESKAPQAQSKAPEAQSKAPEAQSKAPEAQSKAPEAQSKAPEAQSKAPKANLPAAVDGAVLSEAGELDDNEYDVSSKTLDALLKELPPWRRKKGSKIVLPTRLKQKETIIVGYFNGRPISASDRHLRRRSVNTTSLGKIPEKSSPAKDKLPSQNKKNEKILSKSHMPIKHEVGTVIKQETKSSEQVQVPSSDTESNQLTKSTKTKQLQKLKKAQGGMPDISDQLANNIHNTEPRRKLRSAEQKSTESPKLTSDGLSSTELSSSSFLPSEQLPTLALHPPSDLLVPLTTPLQSASSKISEQNANSETMKVNIETTQLTTTEEKLNNEVESPLNVKQKLRSSKADANDKKNMNCPSSKISNQLLTSESQTHISLRYKRVSKNAEAASEVASQPNLNVAPLEKMSASVDDGGSSITDRPTRMPLRSGSVKPEIADSVTRPQQKLALRSQRHSTPSTNTHSVVTGESDVALIRTTPGVVTKGKLRPIPASLPRICTIAPKHEPVKSSKNKFLHTLNSEASQHLISNLNIRYDKMQKGWLQMDKEAPPTTKYKNKADRQAAIWKSKRRIRKSKSEHQKHSPVQMLFVKGFNLSSICRWFLESSETKSLVIVKNVNTRLPSETQLCFHSSSASGTSQGVFPSLQAERLKKHLKKFAIASPVKSNPRSQKLIAKTLEQDAISVKGKERELLSEAQTLKKSASCAKACAQTSEPQKTAGKSKNPASARILRKYSNIREKMQVQQTTARLKGGSKIIKGNTVKKLVTAKPAVKSNLKPSKEAPKTDLPGCKESTNFATKMNKKEILAKKETVKHTATGKAVQAQGSNKTKKDLNKKEKPTRSSQRLSSPKMSDNSVPSKSKVNKKHTEVENKDMDMVAANNARSKKTKASLKSSVAEVKAPESTSQEAKVASSPDQVLTRSQRKMEAVVPPNPSTSNPLEKTAKSASTRIASPKSAKKAHNSASTRSADSKSAPRRVQAASSPRTAAKRALKLLETPAKRTRTSVTK
ncbi:uncharacterized protein LOC114476610 isoform X2 [Gouania willdenowi]|uniref:uncharacterized protein LOC114476610 isoform X2 n=1 Tax=Gouania willdenowi TaxID=441366 RepID=UPI0010558B4C|nr:uncharacterized protein LOC114476610 isoform X2 [Gouania willdenowi]